MPSIALNIVINATPDWHLAKIHLRSLMNCNDTLPCVIRSHVNFLRSDSFLSCCNDNIWDACGNNFLPRYGEEIISVEILYDAACEDVYMERIFALRSPIARVIKVIFIYIYNRYFIYIYERSVLRRKVCRTKKFKVKDGYIPCNQL